ncbi:hypothetical protein BMF94_1985 [Rhodotorula taiwanensis]|uniref:Uncharacterized protein n=1 Tax=Rhodotorula taiwanensis TaxID=741276 RepID=A0A2S5BE15_9BASI|nr:hypothetical protein BMF94_1985 [Rhodotorula taiwanensis]
MLPIPRNRQDRWLFLSARSQAGSRTMPPTAAARYTFPSRLRLGASVLLLSLCLSVPVLNAQELTTYTDTGAQIVTTTIAPTVYTTEGQVFTWTATTPSTVTPVTFSTGSIMDMNDYIRSKSAATAISLSAPSQTASLRGGHPNALAVDHSSAAAPRGGAGGVGTIGTALALGVVLSTTAIFL